MPDLQPYFDAAGVGLRAAGYTGVPSDAVRAGAYAAWIESVTGSLPKVQREEGRAIMVLTDEQHRALRAWLTSLTRPSVTPPRLSFELKPTLIPFALQYVIPIAAAAFLAGWISKGVFR